MLVDVAVSSTTSVNWVEETLMAQIRRMLVCPDTFPPDWLTTTRGAAVNVPIGKMTAPAHVELLTVLER